MCVRVCLREFNVHPSNKFWSSRLINYSIRGPPFGLSKREREGEVMAEALSSENGKAERHKGLRQRKGDVIKEVNKQQGIIAWRQQVV